MNVTMPTAVLAPLGELTGADYNPRTMGDAEMIKLIRSLEEFGFVEPVVAREEDGLIIGGHQRVAAMRQLLVARGLDEAAVAATEVPVVFLSGLADARTTALTLALNKIHGDWDYGKLADLFENVEDDVSVLAQLSGFSFDEMQDIVGLLGSDAPEVDAGPPIDVDDALATRARRFVFDVATDDEAAELRGALATHGMTSVRDAGAALLSVVRSAGPPLPAAPKPPKRGKKKEADPC